MINTETKPSEEVVIKLLEVSPAEEKDLKQKMYMKVYDKFLNFY